MSAALRCATAPAPSKRTSAVKVMSPDTRFHTVMEGVRRAPDVGAASGHAVFRSGEVELRAARAGSDPGVGVVFKDPYRFKRGQWYGKDR